MREKLEKSLEDTQSGFRRKEELMIRFLLGKQAKNLSGQRQLHVCFIDMEKAFETVNINIDGKYLKKIGAGGDTYTKRDKPKILQE